MHQMVSYVVFSPECGNFNRDRCLGWKEDNHTQLLLPTYSEFLSSRFCLVSLKIFFLVLLTILYLCLFPSILYTYLGKEICIFGTVVSSFNSLHHFWFLNLSVPFFHKCFCSTDVYCLIVSVHDSQLTLTA
jgi:hypothetical protein